MCYTSFKNEIITFLHLFSSKSFNGYKQKSYYFIIYNVNSTIIYFYYFMLEI